MSSIVPQKRCYKCGKDKPATTEYFYICKREDDGLQFKCKACEKAYRVASKEKRREYAREYRAKNADRLREEKRQYREENKEAIAKKKHDYHAVNRERISAWRKLYYARNSRHLRDYQKKHKAANSSLIKRRYAVYRQSGGARVSQNNRRARSLSLVATFTTQQWHYALDYFRGCCAVCGRQLKDLFGTHTVAQDHWIPLSSPNCPGTTVTNIVPLCHGEDGCNNSKKDRDPLEWLVWKYGKSKGMQIFKRVEAYLELVGRTHG